MKKTFEEVKQYCIDRAKELNACNEIQNKLENAQSIDEILKIGVDNLNWVSSKNMFKGDIEQYFDREKLVEFKIANIGENNVGFSNTGDRNTGDWNTGDSNTGDWNTGDRNTGHSNTGDRNTGDRNTGDRNTGHSNTGDWNTGYRNTGDRNTGHSNTGDNNTGDWNAGHSNTGDWNTGDWNTGNRNTGLFNRDTPKLRIFEQESDWTYQDWYNSKSYNASQKLILTEWISEDLMTYAEQIENPLFYVQGGYLKKYKLKEAYSVWWEKLTKIERNSFKDIPNFNAEIFLEITGCKLD